MRRHLPVLLVLAGCQPSLPYTAPGVVVTAVFDPTTSSIPLPNDLAFFNPPNSVCPPPANMLPASAPPACAQAELLASFGGAFPSDQAVPITIDFVQYEVDGTKVAPDLDLATFTGETLFVVGTTANSHGDVAMAPITADDYVKAADHGTLTLHHAGHAPWATGSYAVFVRGGPEGVKTTAGVPVGPSQVFHLIAQGLDMTDPRNLGLLKAQLGSTAAALEQGAQLNQLISLYKGTAFPLVDAHFPHQELAILTTFGILPTVTNVTIDPTRGLVPLPIDLLRDPTSGHLSPLAACTLAGSHLAADGTCPSPAAAGFLALDGFSTTGAILAPTSDLIQAATVTPTSVRLFDLSDPANPAPVNPATLVLEPCEFTSACGSPTALSPVIAIQPAGATAGDPTSVFRSRPLKDQTDYAVVVTTAVHDKAGKPVGPGTVANVLRFLNPITVAGKSALVGIDDGTAASLEKMRLQLAPVFTTLAAGGVARDQVAIAYTFRTQTILSQAVQLAALPYTRPAATALPIAATLTTSTPAAAFAKYGVDAAVVPLANIDEVLEVDITTFNALDPVSGAFVADPTQAAAETIHVLITTPRAINPKVPTCSGAFAQFGKCPPLMVFRHGLNGGRGTMLTVADSYAEAGMVTVAIDAAKHGDRAFCTSGTTGAASGCTGGAACTTTLPAGAQGDEHPPGTCGAAGFVKRPVSGTCVGTCAAAATDGIPNMSGNYLVSPNFFRTRDTLRQDLIDESQLIRALAFVPNSPPPTGHAVFDHVIARGMIIDPTTVYYSSLSLGSVQGAANVATNPRITKAAFNTGGGTAVDIFATAPAFADQTNGLLGSLGIVKGTSAYLQFLVVAKTILDPADPINFVGHLTANTLPNLLPPIGGNVDGSVPQAAKRVLMQMATCDLVTPNPFNLIFASTIPTGPLPTGASFFAPGGIGTFQLFVTAPYNPASFGHCPTSAVPHGFLVDWLTPSLTATAQTDIVNFMMLDTLPLRVQHQ